MDAAYVLGASSSHQAVAPLLLAIQELDANLGLGLWALPATLMAKGTPSDNALRGVRERSLAAGNAEETLEEETLEEETLEEEEYEAFSEVFFGGKEAYKEFKENVGRGAEFIRNLIASSNAYARRNILEIESNAVQVALQNLVSSSDTCKLALLDILRRTPILWDNARRNGRLRRLLWASGIAVVGKDPLLRKDIVLQSVP